LHQHSDQKLAEILELPLNYLIGICAKEIFEGQLKKARPEGDKREESVPDLE